MRASQRRFAPRQPFTKEPRRIPTDLGPVIRSLASNEIDVNLGSGMAEITDCELIASYNLMDGLSKTMLVPGRPPLWTPSSGRSKLSPDSGTYYRDENAARFQDYPLEPVVRAIFQMDPSFDPSSIDIVACGSTLGNLLRFVRDTGEPFSFVVHTIGRTAFFVRRELSPTELIDGVYGFGHSFVEANTTWSQDVKGSSSHQRIIAYTLGGQRVLVRFEADGYTMDQADGYGADDSTHGVPLPPSSVFDQFADLLQPRTPAAETSETIVLKKGSQTAQSSTIDIKTRSFRKDPSEELAQQLPRLWLRQIDNIVLSFHNNGVFEPAAVENISSKVLDWENQNQPSISRLANLIDLIKSAAAQADGGKLEVRCVDPTSLQFHKLSPTEQSKWHAVPKKLHALWAQEE